VYTITSITMTMDATAVVIVLTTLPADADAAALARQLIDERLAACVNALPIMASIYRWEGAIQEDRERQLVIKTSAARLEALQTRLHELHPYQVPEFVVLQAAGASGRYAQWVDDSVAQTEA
jgi:periplasmic divalent cation tolerance protein